MSYFRSKGIVLKKTKYGEKEFLYSIFSYDFWKIEVLKKNASKEKPLDIWYDINFEVHSYKNSQLSRIAHIKIINEFDPSKHKFKTINAYLWLIHMVYIKSEKKNAIFEIYILLHELHKIEITKEKILLAQLKIKNIFWELPINHSDTSICSVLKFIHNNSSKNCLRIKGISESQTEIFEKIIEN